MGCVAQALGTLCLLMSYGIAVIPLCYCYAFGFSSPSAAQVAVAGLNLVAGFVITMGSCVMVLIDETKAAQKILVHFFRLMPPFNLGAPLTTRCHAAASNTACITPACRG